MISVSKSSIIVNVFNHHLVRHKPLQIPLNACNIPWPHYPKLIQLGSGKRYVHRREVGLDSHQRRATLVKNIDAVTSSSHDVTILSYFETVRREVNGGIQRALILDVQPILRHVEGVETTLPGGVVLQGRNIGGRNGRIDVWNAGTCVGEIEDEAVGREGNAVRCHCRVFNDANVAGGRIVSVGGRFKLRGFRIDTDIAREH